MDFTHSLKASICLYITVEYYYIKNSHQFQGAKNIKPDLQVLFLWEFSRTHEIKKVDIIVVTWFIHCSTAESHIQGIPCSEPSEVLVVD